MDPAQVEKHSSCCGAGNVRQKSLHTRGGAVWVSPRQDSRRSQEGTGKRTGGEGFRHCVPSPHETIQATKQASKANKHKMHGLLKTIRYHLHPSPSTFHPTCRTVRSARCTVSSPRHPRTPPSPAAASSARSKAPVGRT